MNKLIKLSVVISAHNEEKKIKKCLESVKDLADEIIFVDNSSNDKTVEIAGSYTNKIIAQKNDPSNIDLQKNIGIEKSTGDWILVLDADEIVSEELKDEIIKNIIKHLHPTSDILHPIMGYEIPRKNIIFGKWIEHSGWYPDYQLRLFRRNTGKYESKHYHEPIVVDGNIEKLNGHIIHHNYESIQQFLYKHLLVYAPNEADELLKHGYDFDWRGIIRMPMSEFLSRYFARKGYRDGFHGLVLAILMAYYHLVIFLHIWEKQKFIEVKSEEIINSLDEDLKKSKKEINYWLNTRGVDEEKNKLKKFAKKIKRNIQL